MCLIQTFLATYTEASCHSSFHIAQYSVPPIHFNIVSAVSRIYKAILTSHQLIKRHLSLLHLSGRSRADIMTPLRAMNAPCARIPLDLAVLCEWELFHSLDIATSMLASALAPCNLSGTQHSAIMHRLSSVCTDTALLAHIRFYTFDLSTLSSLCIYFLL